MDDLVETLAIGLLVSLVLIFIAWWFWKRYDRPSPAQIEREETLAKKQQETRMWRAVEAQMAQEKAALEEKALYERKKAEERARALPPPTSEVSNAFAAFDLERQPEKAETFEQSRAAPDAEAALADPIIEAFDDSILHLEERIEVRQDQGVVLAEHEQLPELPLEHTTAEEAEAVEDSIPPAPDLDALIGLTPIEETATWPAEQEATAEASDWSDNWFANLEEE